MTKYAAFGTQLEVGVGDVQIETATVIGTITGSGNARVIVTCTGMTGTPVTTDVAVLNLDSAAVVAGKIRAALAEVAAIAYLFEVSGTGATVVLTRKIPIATIANLNIDIDNQTCTGLTDAPTSTATHAGEETYATVVQVQSFDGPDLSLDTDDVTTHDSPGAFEEVVATILRTGELSMDIVYDPNHATHDASTGLIALMEARALIGNKFTFPDGTLWYLASFVTGFKPAAPHDGKLAAAVKMKISGAPILA